MEKIPLLTTRMSMFDYPQHIPGYTGHCSQKNYQFGETYGNFTKHQYSLYHDKYLGCSKERHGRGGDKIVPFPKYYQYEPTLVVSSLPKDHTRWTSSSKYRRHNMQDRDDSLAQFKVAAEDHREQYKDYSQIRQPVERFYLGKLSLQWPYKKSPIWSRNYYTVDMNRELYK